MHTHTQSGNALFLILIAIFLLGGLTVLMTRTGSQTEETGEAEKNTIQASKILRYATSVKSSVDMLLAKGCSENSLSMNGAFNTDGTEITTSTFYNPNAPSDFSCHVYHVNGGGQKLQYSVNGVGFYQQAIHNVGTTKNELYMNSRLDMDGNAIDIGLCDAINRVAGNNISVSSLPQADVSSSSFTGTFPTTQTLGDNGAEVGMAGIKAACVTDTTCGAGTCPSFYYVLLAR